MVVLLTMKHCDAVFNKADFKTDQPRELTKSYDIDYII